jgi:uncharacterized membrane protein YfcA
MEYVVIPIVALLSSILTLLSGFGLGMLLSAAMFLFFPLDVAVAITAVVHFANNIFKFSIFKKYINYGIVLKFGLPALIFSFLGALLLTKITGLSAFAEISFGTQIFKFFPLNATLGFLMIFFAWVPLNTKKHSSFIFLASGGILSGFFGGLAGHQGGIRSAFLSKLKLRKEVFIASGVMISLIVDITRISVYFKKGVLEPARNEINLVLLAILFAFIGVYFGKKLMEKTTFEIIKKIVQILLTFQGILVVLNIV